MFLPGLGVVGLLLLALLAPWVSVRGGRRAGWWLAAAPAALFVAFLLIDQGIHEGRLVTRFNWVPSLGIEVGLALDEMHGELDCVDCHEDRAFHRPPSCESCHDEPMYPDQVPGEKVVLR